MKQWKNLTDGSIHNFLICSMDITGFGALLKTKTAQEILSLMKDVTLIISEQVERAGGLVIKYIGDAALVIFDEADVDGGVRCVTGCDKALLDMFRKKDLPNRISTVMHFGEAVIGRLPPFSDWDIFGKDVNLVFVLENKGARGRLMITPQVFRKLAPETRKMFHKFKPPVVYYRE
jgi:class 3 adenylate cyclase